MWTLLAISIRDSCPDLPYCQYGPQPAPPPILDGLSLSIGWWGGIHGVADSRGQAGVLRYYLALRGGKGGPDTPFGHSC